MKVVVKEHVPYHNPRSVYQVYAEAWFSILPPGEWEQEDLIEKIGLWAYRDGVNMGRILEREEILT